MYLSSVMNLKEWKAKHHISVVYRHQSPFDSKILKPLSYKELEKSRSLDMPTKELEQYMSDRIKEEQGYHRLLKGYPKENSFLYATIVGCHKMESPMDYPGFTYYFTLSDEQLSNVIFHVVADENISTPKLGVEGFKAAINYWKDNKDELVSSEDEWFDAIDPRIEVVIPFSVKPFAHIEEEENRE
jgi:hypothetical protein